MKIDHLKKHCTMMTTAPVQPTAALPPDLQLNCRLHHGDAIGLSTPVRLPRPREWVGWASAALATAAVQILSTAQPRRGVVWCARRFCALIARGAPCASRTKVLLSASTGTCGPTSGILKQTNQFFKLKSQTVKPKLLKTASFSSFSAFWFKVLIFRVQTVKPNR